MSNTVLITIGRLPKALDFARAFSSAGWRVIVADPHARHLTGVSNAVARSVIVPAPAYDRDGFLTVLMSIVATEAVDLVLPVSEETMYVAALNEAMPTGVAYYGVSQERTLALHDKLAFPQRAQIHGLTAPETYALESHEATTLAQTCDVVVKPVYSCSGRSVSFLSAGSDLTTIDANEPMVVQPRLKGPLFSTFSICHDGAVQVTVIYRAAVMSGTVAVCFERVDDQPAIATWVEQFVAAERHTGFIAFDMIVTDDGQTWAIECNPRATSGVHFIEPDDLVRAIVAPERGRAVRIRPNRKMQQFYPCLTETQASLIRLQRSKFVRNFRHLISARDVTWDRRDPKPFMLLPIVAADIMRRAFVDGQSFGEAATHDIAWVPADTAATR